MIRYVNNNGDSGVTYYEIGNGYIKIKFGESGTYLYTVECCGSHNMQEMKKRAEAGQGLNSYINTNRVVNNCGKKIV